MRPRNLPTQHGFTLVELVVVIVVMGIMAFGTVSFITRTAESYQATATGDRLGSTGRIVIEQLSREIRSALPNSVRTASSAVSGSEISCLELVPTREAGGYLRLPDGSDPTLGIAPLFAPPHVTSFARAAVFPFNSTDVYQNPGSELAISPEITTPIADMVISASNPPASAAEVSVSFATSHLYPAGSPQKRWFLVGRPISFCVVESSGQLYRYEDTASPATYSYSQNQAVPPALSTPAAGRWLLADGIYPPTECGGSGSLFQLVPPASFRNATVLLDLCVKDAQGQQLQLVHEVALRNVP